MPRTSRAVAQRLGTKQKSRRRTPRRAPETPASVERILDEVAPTLEGVAPTAVEPIAPASRAPSTLSRRGATATVRGASRAVPSRRRYAEYAAEYAYVWTDLRRIVLVSGALLALLIVLSFFIG